MSGPVLPSRSQTNICKPVASPIDHDAVCDLSPSPLTHVPFVTSTNGTIVFHELDCKKRWEKRRGDRTQNMIWHDAARNDARKRHHDHAAAAPCQEDIRYGLVGRRQARPHSLFDPISVVWHVTRCYALAKAKRRVCR